MREWSEPHCRRGLEAGLYDQEFADDLREATMVHAPQAQFQGAEHALHDLAAIFKDVRFYPILSFGLFWAPLFSRCFHSIMNFGHFWAPPSSRCPATRNFGQFWADPHFFSR